MIHFYSADCRVPIRDRVAHRNWLNTTATERGFSIDYLAFVFCSDDYLLEMNNKYLQHDYFTDIITFPLVSETGLVNAECYLSVDRIKDNAKANGCTFAVELRRVMVHGLLHLIGEDDKSQESQRNMRLAEEKALTNWLFHVERNDHKTK